RIVVAITLEGTERLRRIRAQDVVATQGKGGVVQQRLPARHGGCLFNYFLLLATLYLFAILGIARHRVLFHWLSEDQSVRQLTIPEPDRSDPVLHWHVISRGCAAESKFGAPLFSRLIEVTG